MSEAARASPMARLLLRLALQSLSVGLKGGLRGCAAQLARAAEPALLQTALRVLDAWLLQRVAVLLLAAGGAGLACSLWLIAEPQHRPYLLGVLGLLAGGLGAALLLWARWQLRSAPARVLER